MRTSLAIRAAVVWCILCSPLAAAQEPGLGTTSTPPAPWSFSAGVGLQVPFLQLEGVSPLALPGLEVAGSYQTEHLQVRINIRALAAASLLTSGEGPDQRQLQVMALEGDVGLRLAVGSFSFDSSFYGYAQPGLFLMAIEQSGVTPPEGDTHLLLGSFGMELGVGTRFKLGQSHFELNASVARVVLSPESLKTQVLFTPGVFVAYVFG